MTINNLSKTPSLLHYFLSEIRDVTIQNDPLRFRRNIERIGEIMAYEISKDLQFKSKKISTPLAPKDTLTLNENVVICSVLRAGLTLHHGFLNYFDRAENAFISAYRHHPNKDEKFEIIVEYFASPSLEGKTVLLVDPMLATGRSLAAVYDGLLKNGTPKNIHVAAVIASPEGVEYISNHFPENTKLWIAEVDEKLNNKGYIIPGLGDAGDLAYGIKL